MLHVLLFLCMVQFPAVSAGITPKPYCYQNKCRCYGNRADCRYNDDALTFIPRLPENITSVDFSFNTVRKILNSHFFDNVTHITSLRMVSTGLAYIAPGAFDKLRHLQRLDLSFNFLPTLPEETLGNATRRRLLSFDVSQNRFHCNVGLLWLAKWRLESPCVFVDNTDQTYTCYAKDYNVHGQGEHDLNQFACDAHHVCTAETCFRCRCEGVYQPNALQRWFRLITRQLNGALVIFAVLIAVLACALCRLLCRSGRASKSPMMKNACGVSLRI